MSEINRKREEKKREKEANQKLFEKALAAKPSKGTQRSLPATESH